MPADSRTVAVIPQSGQVQAYEAPLTPAILIERRALIKAAITEVMVEGVHFGVIPGTNKHSLLKDGAELLLSMFHIAVEPVVEDLCTPTEVRWKVEARGIAMGTGMYLGSGIGVCSSNEEKYRWRRAKTRKEFDKMYERDPGMVRIKYGEYNGRETEDYQVRQSPYDAYQTILSMADKRASVALCKRVLAASECLSQRAPPKRENAWGTRPKTEPSNKTPPVDKSVDRPKADPPKEAAKPATPAAQPAAPAMISEEQVEHISRRLDSTGIPDSAFLASFEIGMVGELEASRFDAAVAWLDRNDP